LNGFRNVTGLFPDVAHARGSPVAYGGILVCQCDDQILESARTIRSPRCDFTESAGQGRVIILAENAITRTGRFFSKFYLRFGNESQVTGVANPLRMDGA